MQSKDFEGEGAGGGWWSRKPAKDVLEAPAKTTTRLLPRTATLKVRKIKPAKVERNPLPCATPRLRRIATLRPSAISPTRRSLRRRRIDVVRVEAKLVIDLPLLVVAQNIVGFRDLLELLLSFLIIGIHVRMIFARGFAERTAVNSPIQGTAADLIKMAMVRIDRALGGMESRLLLQVHDELVLEAPPRELDRVKRLVKEEMEGVCDLMVPLLAEVGAGDNWRDAK